MAHNHTRKHKTLLQAHNNTVMIMLCPQILDYILGYHHIQEIEKRSLVCQFKAFFY